MVILMDSTLAYAYNNLFSEGINAFFITLRTLNLKPFMLILIPFVALFLPLIGMLVYFLTNKISQKNPLILSNKHLLQALVVIVGLVISADYFITSSLPVNNHLTFKKRVPLMFTFFDPAPEKITLAKPLSSLPKEPEIIQAPLPFMNKKPNVFLFIIETLRKDFITDEIAPTLYAFGKQYQSSKISVSAANASHISWYSIMHGKYPLYWKQCKKNWSKGSLALRLLKKAGYKIEVITAAELSYFQLDQVMFGKNHCSIDQFIECENYSSMQPWKRDQVVMNTLKTRLTDQGTCYIVFLDSTHSEYSWPDNFPIKFKPVCDGIDYLAIGLSKKSLPKIINRYKNAIHYVDNLISDFINTLKSKKLYEEALIAITGDHGEELFEQGALFHGTHLNTFQTQVPLFIKLGNTSPLLSTSQIGAVSHTDIFPTLLAHLFQQEFPQWFDGEPLYKEERCPYTITAYQSSGKSPHYFYIHNGTYQLHLQFDKTSIFKQKVINLIGIHNQNNTPIHPDQHKEYLQRQFANVFERVF